jgi:hypothetical protein
MNAKSEEAGFIVVYPYGTGAFEDRLLTFNGGGCCGYAMEKKFDDVGFTRALLDDLATALSPKKRRMRLMAGDLRSAVSARAGDLRRARRYCRRPRTSRHGDTATRRRPLA